MMSGANDLSVVNVSVPMMQTSAMNTSGSQAQGTMNDSLLDGSSPLKKSTTLRLNKRDDDTFS